MLEEAAAPAAAVDGSAPEPAGSTVPDAGSRASQVRQKVSPTSPTIPQ
jgi:hypothetical protein